MSKSWITAFVLGGIMALTALVGSVHAALWLFGSGLAAIVGLRRSGTVTTSDRQ